MMAKKATENNNLLAKGGGNATAGGVTMQASVAASFAVRILASDTLDSRLGLGAAKPIAIRCEAEIPVDDVAVETDAGGWAFIQSKNSLRGSFVLTSELGKTCDEIARLWLLAEKGKGEMGWDRPLVGGRDAVLIAVGHETSGPIKVGLAKALNAVRMKSTATLAKAEGDLLKSFKTLMRSALDAHGAPTKLDLDSVLKFVHIIDYDFRGPQRELAEQVIKSLLELSSEAPGAFKAIERDCQNAMAARGRLDGDSLRTSLAADGILLKTAAKGLLDTQADIKADTQALLDGQRDLKRAFSGSLPENPIVTEVASRRLMEMKQARFLVGVDSAAACKSLLSAIDTGDLSGTSGNVRQSIFAWSARVLSATDHDKALNALSKAQEFGPSAETIIARAFVEAFAPNGDKKKALAELAPLDTPESRAASLIIAVHNLSPVDGLQWLQRTGLSIELFNPDGKFRILGMHLEVDDIEAALNIVNSLSAADFEVTPGLLFLAGHTHLEQTVHSDLREALQAPLPPDLADFPLADDSHAMTHRAKAIDYYQKATAALGPLGAKQAASIAADRVLWLQLRDPSFAKHAMESLQASMADEKVRLRRIPLAFAFSLDLNLQAVEEDIERATMLSGGKSLDAAVARFEVALRRKAPEVAAYIERHRDQLLEYYQPDFLISIEIEALTKAGRTEEARSKIAILEGKDIPSNALLTLRNLVEGAAGADAAALRETEYRANPTIPALMSLVVEVRKARDFPKLAEFAEILFEQVKDVASAETYSAALYEIHDDYKIASLAEAYPEIVKASASIGATVAWAYYRLGKLADAKSRLEKLRGLRDVQNDRLLSMNIAIASGDWSSLNSFVESEWFNRDKREAIELLRAGTLAKRIGSAARSQELVREAAKKADSDPNVLIGAYDIASSSGWENEDDIHSWLATAIKTSGESGPVQRMDLRQLIDDQPRWNEKIDNTWDLLVRGETPMFAAAQAARRTLLDLTMRPALQNLDKADPRKRALIFSFSGNRPISAVEGKRLAFDITGLLSLALTGHLRRVLDWSESAFISHTTLSWLFEERAKLSFHQPSQVRRASEVKRLLDAGNLHLFEGSAAAPAVEHEVGEDIAKYLVAAQTVDSEDNSQKMVIRSYPLHKPGSLLEEEADISGFEAHLAGCADLIEALYAAGRLKEAERASALAFLQLHETAWPHGPRLQAGAILYLDDVTVSYLQHLKLLPRLAQAGFKAFITASEAEKASELMNFEEFGAEAHRAVEELQTALRDGIAAGKVVLGPLLPVDDADESFDLHPSRIMIAQTPEVDALVIDDRFMNRFAKTNNTSNATSIDVLARMANEGAMSEGELTEAITLLRQAGAILIPHRPKEILNLLNAAPIVDGFMKETAELRAVREAVVRVRMTDVLQLPVESEWIDTLTRELLIALRAQWQDTVPDGTARARSNWALNLLDVRGWAHRAPLGAADTSERYRTQVLMLTLLNSVTPEVRERYWHWLEEVVLSVFKEEEPESYANLLDSVRSVIHQEVDKVAVEGEPDE